MADIRYEIIQGDDAEVCRELCNELMAFQKSKATFLPDVFDMMNFDTRLKPSYANTEEKYLVVAFHEDEAIGYVYATAEVTTEADRSFVPPWFQKMDQMKDAKGFYPDWLEVPQKTGGLSNLYVKPEYQGRKVGSTLYEMGMNWMKDGKDLSHIFVHVSNGNQSAYDFYLRHGFEPCHEVFCGFIHALVYKV